ncbi:WSC domain-containing protein [Staphylotrichum tortipilum]|uniref:WSC domain-containing protein n=1 Tax=Staphylotrichum tortipilum TaxID=2831512 RepID=A0AAN6RSH6_9PEZI|nr:WSC domain-containing protein [Staphylotrichum longicolle]
MASTRSNTGIRAASILYLASIASALPALGDFKFHGCYTDHGGHRSLTGKKSYDPKMTLQMCAATCHGYQWFGVEYGSQCFCGTSLAATAEKHPDTDNLEEVDGFRYQSCWTDNTHARSLMGSENPRQDMTVEMCAGFCKGFKYFGVESTSECFCGDELGGQAAPEEECSELCGGNPAEWCGGPDRLNIYAVESSAAESTSTAPEESTTLTAESTTVPEESTTVTEESTTVTEVTPTPSPTPTPTPTTPCSLTTLFLPTPTNCWASIPTACAALNRTPNPPWGAVTAQASACTRAFLAESYSLATAVAPCFTAFGDRINFNANSAYTCLSQADVYCQPTAVCKEAPRPAATNVLGEGGFEDGAFWPNADSGMGGADVISVGITSERVRTGNFALKMVYTNANAGSRSWTNPVRLEAGGLFEISWWYWSTNDRSATVTRVYFNGGGLSFAFDVSSRGMPTGQWVRASKTFVAASTYGTAMLSVFGNRETDGNVLYVDDVSIIRID